MSYYNEKPFFDTLKFSDIYPDVETFEEIIGEKCTSSELLSLSPLPELYRTLELKFYNAHTRYTTPEIKVNKVASIFSGTVIRIYNFCLHICVDSKPIWLTNIFESKRIFV